MRNSDHTPGEENTNLKPTAAKKSWVRKLPYRILSVCIIVAVVLGVNYVASLSFEQVRLADYYNYDIRKLDKENADVDMIILGASQVYHGCQPDVISSEMGIGEVIDCSTASLVTDSGYYMLRDMFRRFDPEYVLVEFPWNKFLVKEESKVKRAQLLATDRIGVLDSIDFAIHCFEPERWLDLFAMYRYGGTLWGGFGRLWTNYTKRKAIAEGNWVDESKRSYRKNGYCWFAKSSPMGSITTTPEVYSNDALSDHELKYIKMTQELCEENGAKLVWFTMPTSLAKVYTIENYQESVDHMEEFAEESGCPYLNFNLLKDREQILPDTYYTDDLHLNGEGSEIFSPILVKAVQMALNGEDTSSLFYEDFAALQKDVHRIVTCKGTLTDPGDGTIVVNAESWQNADITPEYRVLATDENGENGVELRTWQEGKEFVLQAAEIPAGSILRLEARQKGQTDADAYQKKLK